MGGSGTYLDESKTEEKAPEAEAVTTDTVPAAEAAADSEPTAIDATTQTE